MSGHPVGGGMPVPVLLDGESLTLASFVAVARSQARVEVADWSRLEASRRWLDQRLDAWRAGEPVAPMYGITTGFGSSKNVVLGAQDLEAAQVNLIRSHAFGIAEGPDDLFAEEVVRGAALLRANTFLQGRSGVRRELAEMIVALLNARVHPVVPLRGSVGASGDLCPLAHFALVLIGEGEATIPDASASGGRARVPGAQALAAADLAPIHLSAKEGLALINGTTFSTACLALAAADAATLARSADVACMLSLEALGGHARALDAKVHAARRQRGQQQAAESMRRLLAGSRLASSTDDRQDPYSLRCAPQVHGAVRDALSHVLSICERELNAVTDNPLLFALEGDDAPWDAAAFGENARRLGREPDAGLSYSAGNFHGEPIAMAADILSIAVAELASISERRIALLVNPAFSRGLPAHLACRPGAQSGLMLAQYTAASLVAENKGLAHPACVDSIPTGNGVEDHVPMATWAARKAARIVMLTSQVLAIECVVAAQAADWRVLLPDPHVPSGIPDPAQTERLAVAFEALAEAAPHAVLAPATAAAHAALRSISPRVVRDRSVAAEIALLAPALRDGLLVRATGDATIDVKP
jgi:histidine ammonia-lyase